MVTKPTRRPCTVRARSGPRALCLLLVASWLAGIPLASATPPTNQPPARVGITYAHDDVTEVPWSIHILKVDRSRADLRFETTLGGGNQLGMGLVSDQLKSLPADAGRVLAAINGDFYNNASKYPGDPKGIQICRGELVSSPDEGRSCFWVDASGAPRIATVQSKFSVTLPDGRSVPVELNRERTSGTVVLYTSAQGASTQTGASLELILKRGADTPWLPLQAGKTYTAQVQEIRKEGNSPLTRDTMALSVSSKVAGQFAAVKVGDTIRVSTATAPEVAGSTTAIGGGPALVHGQKIMSFPGFLQPRAPRTALGWNKDYFFLVVVDGRQRISAGMTFSELATYMLNLGCDEALNLDGGGSATMWYLGNVMNSPSEGRERPAANALLVVKKDQPSQK